VRRHRSSASAPRSERVLMADPFFYDVDRLESLHRSRSRPGVTISIGAVTPWAFSSFCRLSPERIIVAWRLRQLFSVIPTRTDGQYWYG
jgi:hypothetical protein